MAKIKELREKTESELDNLLKDKRESLRKFRFEMSHGKVKNTKEAREIKKDIARILTLLMKIKERQRL
ncbi:MAG: 50S ribosomal protein L29 [Candidatus Tagabacteria bacterium]